MRPSILLCAAALAFGSVYAQADDAQVKCQQKLSANADKLAQAKQLTQLLGNQAVDDTLAQVEGGCDQLGGNTTASAQDTQQQVQAGSTAENITAATETLKGLGSLFGK
ncbi:hypothetical protein [Phytopseudomonas dryadis]|uniref:DUF1090 family protein n=1 Tax=Phytopseudomonas dryadis TaxID=2487520 RepID=A0ABY1Z1R9_9GAMM|nr:MULTISPECIES: hypothetical protein [Pseudomonas]TBV01927.1 hypothetical protein DNK34_20145 [Pseudomonas dryadis]TBV13854.1 hypothetical protein DNK41_21320 [Pseudomonas sp. FRB 230]